MARRPFTVDPQEMVATLLALAAEGGRKWRPTSAELARRRKRDQRRRKAARRAAWKRVEARRPAGRFKAAPFGKRMTDRMTASMTPGEWYGAKDIARLAGFGDGRSAAGKVIQVMHPAGLLERKLNPLWDQHDAVTPRELMAGAVREPKWLYRLTRKGELAREALALMG